MEILEDSGVETVEDFLENADQIQGFLRDEEFDAALTEAKTNAGSLNITERAYQEHSEWHDELVSGGHDPVTKIVDAEDIKQPCGRPREDLPIGEKCPEMDAEVETALATAGYTSGSDFNGVTPETVARDSGLSIETVRPIVEQCRTAYYGLPVLEDNGHPLIPDRETYRAIWTRRTLSGAKDVVDVCYSAAENEYPICLVGYPGVGKSYLISHICAMTNRPLLSIDMDSSLSTEDVLGFHIPEDNQQVTFKYGLFPIAFRNGIWLNINELAAADAGVWLAMHQMTERDPQIMLRSTGEKIDPHPAFRITGTRNPNTDAFAGHGASNEASDSRWEEIWIDYLPKRDEVALLDHMVNRGQRIVSKHQLEQLVDWAEGFRPGVPDADADPDESPEAELEFKNHVFAGQNQNRLPRLSTRELAQICFKSARPGATLRRAAKAVVYHTCQPNKHNIEAAIERAEDINL
ncbi:AAA family ATPase [Haloarcula sp. Atlit-7R]|uniref:AAA family ATPase n=1 Tax=Haloarcula sp. Atlit-7R TaxID=2282125 RepID=UPI0013148645|nr:AAA family ATPase [Haloarcula sp. Atlit-7R]